MIYYLKQMLQLEHLLFFVYTLKMLQQIYLFISQTPIIRIMIQHQLLIHLQTKQFQFGIML